MKLTTSTASPKLEKVLEAKEIIELQETVRRVPIADPVLSTPCASCALPASTRTTRPPSSRSRSPGAPGRAPPRTSSSAARRAPCCRAASTSREDIRGVAHPVLRHRLITNYTAEAQA